MARSYLVKPEEDKPLYILGVDPGLASLGLALICRRQTSTILHSRHTVTTKPGELDLRLCQIWEFLTTTYNTPAVVAIETQDDVLAARTQAGRTSRSAVAVQQVVGLLKGWAWQQGAVVVAVSPAEVKAALTGSRRASKKQIQTAAQRLFSLTVLPDEHQADAISAAVAGGRKLRVQASVARGRRT